MTCRFALFFVAAVAAFWPPIAALAQMPVDLELVLAVDISWSMDPDEQRLQRDGYVSALRDPEIHKAIAAGPQGRIAIVYVEWAGQFSQRITVPWTLVDGPEAAMALAARLESMPISRDRMTSISGALAFAGGLFGKSGYAGLRRVIDVSGDGPNNNGGPVTRIRDELVDGGITINGLPVILKSDGSNSFDIRDLDLYYTDCVIGGAGAFSIPIRERSEFLTATRRKLLLEIAGYAPPARLHRVQMTSEGPRVDCLVGEKLWQRYYGRWPER